MPGGGEGDPTALAMVINEEMEAWATVLVLTDCSTDDTIASSKDTHATDPDVVASEVASKEAQWLAVLGRMQECGLKASVMLSCGIGIEQIYRAGYPTKGNKHVFSFVYHLLLIIAHLAH